MKIVDQRENRRRICVDPGLDLDPGMAWQQQTDKDQQDDEAHYAEKNSLHDVITVNRGTGLFHSTMPG